MSEEPQSRKSFRLNPKELKMFKATGMSWSKFLRGDRKDGGLALQDALLRRYKLTKNGN